VKFIRIKTYAGDGSRRVGGEKRRPKTLIYAGKSTDIRSQISSPFVIWLGAGVRVGRVGVGIAGDVGVKLVLSVGVALWVGVEVIVGRGV
jgi:hypothetical protein